jgi:short-subunit dehydrogenase
VAGDLFDRAQLNGLDRLGSRQMGGPIDILVNNAGMEYTKSFLDTTEREIDDVVRLNLNGAAAAERGWCCPACASAGADTS